MKNIYLLADKFMRAVEKTGAEESSLTKEAAGRQTRKNIEKNLAQAKATYAKHRALLEGHKRMAEELAGVIGREQKIVDDAKENIQRLYDAMKNMDLHDVNEVRFINNDVGYVRGGRLYRLDNNELKTTADELNLEMEDDDTMATDDLLASLVE